MRCLGASDYSSGGCGSSGRHHSCQLGQSQADTRLVDCYLDTPFSHHCSSIWSRYSCPVHLLHFPVIFANHKPGHSTVAHSTCPAFAHFTLVLAKPIEVTSLLQLVLSKAAHLCLSAAILWASCSQSMLCCSDGL